MRLQPSCHQASEDLPGWSASVMAHSNGHWLDASVPRWLWAEALVPCPVDLSIGLLQQPHDTAEGGMRKNDQGLSLNSPFLQLHHWVSQKSNIFSRSATSHSGSVGAIQVKVLAGSEENNQHWIVVHRFRNFLFRCNPFFLFVLLVREIWFYSWEISGCDLNLKYILELAT